MGIREVLQFEMQQQWLEVERQFRLIRLNADILQFGTGDILLCRKQMQKIEEAMKVLEQYLNEIHRIQTQPYDG